MCKTDQQFHFMPFLRFHCRRILDFGSTDAIYLVERFGKNKNKSQSKSKVGVMGVIFIPGIQTIRWVKATSQTGACRLEREQKNRLI
jgi:hypothetical protein